MSSDKKNYADFVDAVNKLLAKNRIEVCIDYIVESLNSSSVSFNDNSKTVVLLSQRHNRLLKQKIRKTIELDKLHTEENDICEGILSFVSNVLSEEDIKLNTKRRYQEILSVSKSNENKNILWVFLLSLAVLSIIGFGLKGDRPDQSMGQVPVNSYQEMFIRDNVTKKIKDISVTAKIFTWSYAAYSGLDSAKVYSIRDSLNIDFTELYKPLKWSLDNIWKDSDHNYDAAGNPSLSRFLEASEVEALNPYIAEQKYKNVWLDYGFWQFKKEYWEDKSDLKFVIMPPQKQLSILVLELEGVDEDGVRLILNTDNSEVSNALREISSKSLLVAPDNQGKVFVGMYLAEESDRISFKSKDYTWDFSIEYLSNPGSWRRPYNRFDDIVVLKFRHQLIGGGNFLEEKLDRKMNPNRK